jgi:NAD(P)H-flavin reductase
LGLAPLRSLIKHVIDEKQRKEFGNITILCGAKQPTELLFTEELEAWQARKDIRCEVTVDVRDAQWQGNVGVITTLLPKLKTLDFRNTVAAICGPPVMYKFVTFGLLELGLPEGHIYLSLERNMKCGVGKCGHCQVNNIYVCREGPVFNYTRLKPLPESLR